MLYIRYVFSWLAGLSFVFLIGCSPAKDGSSSSSSVFFQMPSNLGNGAFAGAACFAVSITADDIEPVSPGTCDMNYGIFGGLIPAGGSVELEAPFGSSRTIDIFYVISDSGCEDFDPSQGLGEMFGSNNVYLISRTENVDFNQPEVVVNAQIEWPVASNSLRSLQNSPASCDKGPEPINLMAVKQARAVLGAARGVTQNGSLMNVRVHEQKIEIKNPTNFSGKLQPARIGEEQ